MKFGKRLAAEAARQWTEQYLDYKSVKRALKADIREGDVTAQQFQAILLQELHKVSKFYVEKAGLLEASLTVGPTSAGGPSSLAATQREIKALIRLVALNYLAVVKAIKKRNRHLKDAFGAAVVPVHPMDVLSHEVFFTSPRLAALATQAEVMGRGLAAAAAAEEAPEQLLAEYECPICLDVLCSPVVLTCAHRFCWGCLVAHFAAKRGCRDPSTGDGYAQGCGQHSACCEEGAAVDAGGEDQEALVVLEKIAAGNACEDSTYYDCPVCRKPQILNIESLTIDPHLAKFVEQLRLQLKPASSPASVGADSLAASSSSSSSGSSSMSTDLEVVLPDSPPAPDMLLPPQLPRHRDQLTVLLDLDGTLISSFTPRKAPRLPPSMSTHVVGMGSSLNPDGVFVVERPGLRQFLERLAGFAEVVVFTAGLEEYAAPIIDAIDPDGCFISSRVFREGTTKTEYYQCVKDMGLVGRDLCRTVLVDDTPLAFLHQPHNGIPVLGFRGDPDDRLLMEAVLPLLQILSSTSDVQPVLERRFDMYSWFRRHGYPESIWSCQSPLVGSKVQAVPSDGRQTTPCCSSKDRPVEKSVSIKPSSRALRGTLLCFDFDKTLTDFDAGERLVGELAPELVPMLASLEMPANFVPITNDILKEMMRRGVSRDKLLQTLQQLGQEIPRATATMLSWAREQGCDVKVLSDCNSCFIAQMLVGAKLGGLVQEVITNPSTWKACMLPTGENTPGLGCSSSRSDSSTSSSSDCGSSSSRFYLSIRPRHSSGQGAHGCKRCPENLCKGRELARIMAQQCYQHIVYAGDGANDICPALRLGHADVLLARRGHGLAAYLAAAAADPFLQQVAASVYYWECHEQLADLVRQHATT